MTVAVQDSVHDLASIQVGDLSLSVAPPTERTTLQITVERDATLVLKAPRSVSRKRAEAFVSSKRSWIYRKLAEKDALVGPDVTKQFVEGEGFAYLGRSHRLLIDKNADRIRLDRGRFVAPAVGEADGLRLMREWYAKAGRLWLRRRLSPWAARIGVHDVTVEVLDLGFRWGSARPNQMDPRINVHWSTLQLPPTLIDYVLVHELTHLREPNHTPEFWTDVSKLMPSYETRKATLAAIGRAVWLGSASSTGESRSSSE